MTEQQQGEIEPLDEPQCADEWWDAVHAHAERSDWQARHDAALAALDDATDRYREVLASRRSRCRRCGWREADADGTCALCATHSEADQGGGS